MTTTTGRKGFTLANSFTAGDVRALLAFHRLVLRGADASHVAASAPIVKVIRKFQQMDEKQRVHDAQKAQVTS